MREKICGLGIQSSIDAVETFPNSYTFMARSGVWNSYTETCKPAAINSIRNSPYGADIYYDSEIDTVYISMPTVGDMW